MVQWMFGPLSYWLLYFGKWSMWSEAGGSVLCSGIWYVWVLNMELAS